MIEKENPNLVSIEEVMAVDSTGTDYYQTQYKIIQSRTVAREVIRRLDLKNSPEFFPPPSDNVSIQDEGRDSRCAEQPKNWMICPFENRDHTERVRRSWRTKTLLLIPNWFLRLSNGSR